MRRRDATTASFIAEPHVGWPTTMSFVLALAVHATLLACSLLVVVPILAPQRAIVVSLIAGGGSPTTQTLGQTPSVTNKTAAPARAPEPRPRIHAKHTTNVPAVSSNLAAPVQSNPSIEGREAAGSDHADAGAGTGGGEGAGEGTGSGVGVGDQRARCVYCPEPTYPLIARRRGWQGTVDVRLSVLADGTVAHAEVARSCGYDVLDQEAVAVARRSRFSPLRAETERGRIQYRFQLATQRQ